jgi:ATP-dependent helicase/nuclease subunit A
MKPQLDSTATAAMQWTPTQAAVIAHREGNLAVSASAGSGKTAVLTERVVRLITGEHEGGPPLPGVALDRMLIITFTEKAAREMRERIESRLRRGLDADPQHPALRAALDALPSAWIMTIDAFCRRLVVEHFHQAGITPDPHTPDAAELSELEGEELSALIEDWGGDPKRREALAALQHCYSGGFDDLIEQTRRLIHYLEALDHPQEWIGQARDLLRITRDAQRIDQLPEAYRAGAGAVEALRHLIDAFRGMIGRAARQGAEAEVLDRWKGIAERLEAWTRLAPPLPVDRIAEEWNAHCAPVLGKLKNKGVCGETLYADKEFGKHVLEPMGSRCGRWYSRWFPAGSDALLHGARLAARQAGLLLDLAEEAGAALAAARRRRGWVTFNDFERLTFEKILSAPERPGEPGEIAYALREHFEHVMVDEYQDTSPLQDAIVRCVARWNEPSPGMPPGNLFLVGDYKQSIYRFRDADPDRFRSVLESGSPEIALEGNRFRVLHLGHNFRSRPGILHGVNRIFEWLMDPAVGEIDYRAGESLIPGRDDADAADPLCVEAQWLVDPREKTAPAEPGDETEEEESPGAELLRGKDAQAAWVARRIRELTRPDQPHPLRPGDCAILLRAMRNELDVWVRALEAEGLKARAAGIDPMLGASELQDLLAALKIADNPFQDLPLAAVMRSPMGGFGDDDLMRIRLCAPQEPFHHAVWHAAGLPWPGKTPEPESPAPPPAELAARLGRFLAMIDAWRETARRRSAEETLDRILADTAFAAYLAGRPDAESRLAHVDYLRQLLVRLGSADDGANPLGRFLGHVERAFGAAEKVGELPEPVGDAGDAVSLMSIHASKGLEFPVVFLPRLERRFHQSRGSDLLLGGEGRIALTGVDVPRRRQYPTLAHAALAAEAARKERSEELRLWYVAMTRARNRLVLVGTISSRDALRERARHWTVEGARLVPTLDRLECASPLQLIGPLIEAMATGLFQSKDQPPVWLRVAEPVEVGAGAAEPDRALLERALMRTGPDPDADWSAAVEELRAAGGDGPLTPETIRLLPSLDPAEALTRLPAKTTVTQLRRQSAAMPREDQADAGREERQFVEEEMRRQPYRRKEGAAARAPVWTEEASGRLDGAQRGTLTHAVLAQVPLEPVPTLETLRRTALDVARRRGQILDPTGMDAKTVVAQLDFEAMAWFFTTDLGRRVCARPRTTHREYPFTQRKAVGDFSVEAGDAFPGESILLQGVIDLVIDEGESATIVDFKTDRVSGERTVERLAEEYRLQLELYGRAVRAIWRIRRLSGALVFLDARAIHAFDRLD